MDPIITAIVTGRIRQELFVIGKCSYAHTARNGVYEDSYEEVVRKHARLGEYGLSGAGI